MLKNAKYTMLLEQCNDHQLREVVAGCYTKKNPVHEFMFRSHYHVSALQEIQDEMKSIAESILYERNH